MRSARVATRPMKAHAWAKSWKVKSACSASRVGKRQRQRPDNASRACERCPPLRRDTALSTPPPRAAMASSPSLSPGNTTTNAIMHAQNMYMNTYTYPSIHACTLKRKSSPATRCPCTLEVARASVVLLWLQHRDDGDEDPPKEKVLLCDKNTVR